MNAKKSTTRFTNPVLVSTGLFVHAAAQVLTLTGTGPKSILPGTYTTITLRDLDSATVTVAGDTCAPIPWHTTARPSLDMPDPSSVSHVPVPPLAHPTAAVTVTTLTIAGGVTNTTLRLCGLRVLSVITAQTATVDRSAVQFGDLVAPFIILPTLIDSQVEFRGTLFHSGGLFVAGPLANSTLLAAGTVCNRRQSGVSGTLSAMTFVGAFSGSASWALITNATMTAASLGTSSSSVGHSAGIVFSGILTRVVIANVDFTVAAENVYAIAVVCNNASSPTSSITIANVTAKASAPQLVRALEVAACHSCRVTASMVTFIGTDAAYNALGVDSLRQPSATFQTLRHMVPLGTTFAAAFAFLSAVGTIEVLVEDVTTVLAANTTALLAATYVDSTGPALPSSVLDDDGPYRSPVTGAGRSPVMSITVRRCAVRVVPWLFDVTNPNDAAALASAIDQGRVPSTEVPHPVGNELNNADLIQFATAGGASYAQEMHVVVENVDVVVQRDAGAGTNIVSVYFLGRIDNDDTTVAVRNVSLVTTANTALQVALVMMMSSVNARSVTISGSTLVVGLSFLGNYDSLLRLVTFPSAVRGMGDRRHDALSALNASRPHRNLFSAFAVTLTVQDKVGVIAFVNNTAVSASRWARTIRISGLNGNAGDVVISGNRCRIATFDLFVRGLTLDVITLTPAVGSVAVVGNTIDVVHTESTVATALVLPNVNGTLRSFIVGSNAVSFGYVRALLAPALLQKIEDEQTVRFVHLEMDNSPSAYALLCRVAFVSNTFNAAPHNDTVQSAVSTGITLVGAQRGFRCASSRRSTLLPTDVIGSLSAEDIAVIEALPPDAILIHGNEFTARTAAFSPELPLGVVLIRNNTFRYQDGAVVFPASSPWSAGAALSVVGNAFVCQGGFESVGISMAHAETADDLNVSSFTGGASVPDEHDPLARLFDLSGNAFLVQPSAADSSNAACEGTLWNGTIAILVNATTSLQGVVSNTSARIANNTLALAGQHNVSASCAVTFLAMRALVSRSLLVSHNTATVLPLGTFFLSDSPGPVAEPSETTPPVSMLPVVDVTRNVVLCPEAALVAAHRSSWRPFALLDDGSSSPLYRLRLGCNAFNGRSVEAGDIRSPNGTAFWELQQCTSTRTVSRTPSAMVTRSPSLSPTMLTSATATRSKATVTKGVTVSQTETRTQSMSDPTETLSLPVRVTRPPPVEVSTAEGAILTTTGVVGGVLGTAGAGSLGTVSRLSAAATALHCDDAALDDEAQPWSNAPLGVTVPAARHAQHYVGAALGNSAIVAATAAVVLGVGVPVAWVRAWRASRGSDVSELRFPPPWRDQLAAAALPSVLVLPVALLLQPTLAVTTACVFGFGPIPGDLRADTDTAASSGDASSNMGAPGVVWRTESREPPLWVAFVGGAMIVACVAGYAAAAYRLLHRFRLVFLPTSRASELLVGGRSSSVARVLVAIAAWCEPCGEWHGQDQGKGRAKAEQDLQRFRLLVDGLAGHCPWYLLLELALSALSGVFEGLQPHLGCALAAWAQLVVLTAALLSLLVVRPYASRIDTAFALSCAVLLVVAAALAVVVQLRWPSSGDADSVGEPEERRVVRAVFSWVTILTAVLSTLRTVWDAALFLLYWGARHRQAVAVPDGTDVVAPRLGRIAAVLVSLRIAAPPAPVYSLDSTSETLMTEEGGYVVHPRKTHSVHFIDESEVELLPMPPGRVPLAPSSLYSETFEPGSSHSVNAPAPSLSPPRRRLTLSCAEMQRRLAALRRELAVREAAVVSAKTGEGHDGAEAEAWSEWQSTVDAIQELCDTPF